VGNLAYDLSEQDVIDYFSQVGPVKSVRCGMHGSNRRWILNMYENEILVL